MATKKVPSPTGKPSKKREEIKEFEKTGKASGGKKTSAYSKSNKKTSTSSTKKTTRKPTPGMLGSGAAAKAGEKLAGRKKKIDTAVKKAGG